MIPIGIQPVIVPPFEVPFAPGSTIPNPGQAIYYNRGMVDTDGVSFTGSVMTLGPTCPFLGIGSFVDGGSYDLSTFDICTDNQIWVVPTTTSYKILIYSVQLSYLMALRVERFLQTKSDDFILTENGKTVLTESDNKILT